MKFYITFGQAHAHSVAGRTFDKDCVAVIEAENYNDGHAKAFELFDRKWCFIDWQLPDMTFFPRGVIEV